MKETRNTLDGADIRIGRGQGNSTRQVDLAIDYLFKGYKVEVRDHHENGKNPIANSRLLASILDRLELEHPRLVKLERTEINNRDCTIQLVEL